MRGNWNDDERTRRGDEALVERIVNGQHFLIGTATIGEVFEEGDGRFIARYSEYQDFAQPIPLPRSFATLISALDGYNPRNSISIIPEDLFLPLLGELRQAEHAQVIAEEVRGPAYERGGGEPPRRRPIGDKPPRPSNRELAKSDPEVRRQAIEKRQTAHHDLVLAFREACRRNSVAVDCTQYADALASGWIFEMKTIRGDAIPQMRSAIGQLYHYLFLHRDFPGYADRAVRSSG